MTAPNSENSSAQSIWLGFAETRPTGRGTRRIHLRWGRIGALAVMLTLGIWIIGASALYFVYREQKGYTEIAFGDVLLFPLKRAEIREAHGNFNIEEAKKALEAEDYRAAYNLILAGVRRAPANLEGRILLIRFFEAQGYHEGSRGLFEQGIPYAGDDLDFYRLYAQFLNQQRDDAAIVNLAQEMLGRLSPDSELARVMALFGMQAAGRLGKFETAQRFFKEADLKNNLEGMVTAANLLAKTGKVDAAIDILVQFSKQYQSQPIGPIYQALTNIYISEKRYDEAIQTALSFSTSQPLEYQPRVLLISAYEAAGRRALAQKEAQTVLRQFRSDPVALTQLGLFAREVGDTSLARRLYELALEGDIAVPRFGLIFLESHLANHEFARTIELCKELDRENPDWLRIYRAEFAVMRALANLGLGNQQLGNIYLNEFLSAEGILNNVLFAVATTFEEIDLPEYALQVLEEAYSRDEKDEVILAHLVGLQVTLGESRGLTERVNQLLQLRRPNYAVFKQVKNELNSDRFVFAENRVAVAENLDHVLKETVGDFFAIQSTDKGTAGS